MRILIRFLGFVVLFLISLLVFSWIGLQMRATKHSPIASGGAPDILPLPTDLPAPVERFAHAVFGETLPDVHTAIVVGRARLAPTGFYMPSRFRFYYDAASSSYYHDIEVTWFTLPVMRIHERNLAGETILDLGLLGRVEDSPKTNRAAIQGYWAEVLAWVPMIALADTRLRWEGVDATTARVYLPDLDAEEALTLRFDSETNLLTEIETMRYQDESDDERQRWRNRVIEWGSVDGMLVPVRSETRWNDESPWAIWDVEQVALNVDVLPRMDQFGGDVP